MKRTTTRLLLSIILLVSSIPAFSEDYTANPTAATESNDDTLTKYVKALSDRLGYDPETDVTPVEAMLDYTFSIAKTGQQILNVFFAAIPVNSAYQDFTTNSSYDSFNTQANILFTDYHTPNGADVSVVKLFDNPTYQDDPVSQSILNNVSTPNASLCPTSGDSSGACLNQNDVMNTVTKDILDKNSYLPGETMYFTADNSLKFISQLNANTLLAPLIYDTTSTSSNSVGLPAQNQLQAALNFVRYASEQQVLPADTMSQSDYQTLWSKAKTSTEGLDQDSINDIKNAQKELNSYLVKLRVYAAQSSVAMSNLYSILAKRIPQAGSTDANGATTTTTSQALNEFQSATWRLYNPAAKSSSDQWVDQINKASSATIQKEIAFLLAEMKYESYLTRQQQERILLTDTLALIQLIANNKPNISPLNGGNPESSS